MTPAEAQLAELLARYHLGMIPAREGRRLAAIFATDPHDALDRLDRAAHHLRITGAQADTLVTMAATRSAKPATDYTEEPTSAV